jgi:hypothetical protein
MKALKIIVAAGVIALVSAAVASAQTAPLNSTTQTNASVTAIYNQVVSTNLTVFTLDSTFRPYRVVVQNTSASEKVKVKWSAVTGSTNALAGCETLAVAGTVGDKVVLEGVIPDPLIISAQAGTTNVTATLNVHVLGRPK